MNGIPPFFSEGGVCFIELGRTLFTYTICTQYFKPMLELRLYLILEKDSKLLTVLTNSLQHDIDSLSHSYKYYNGLCSE